MVRNVEIVTINAEQYVKLIDENYQVSFVRSEKNNIYINNDIVQVMRDLLSELGNHKKIKIIKIVKTLTGMTLLDLKTHMDTAMSPDVKIR